MVAPKVLHLNADTSWLISLPLPSGEFFNILVDPWFKGPQSDVWSKLSTQWHVIPSSVQHVKEIKDAINAIVISHEFTDHMHRATLEECDKNIPVFATTKAASIIRTWNHFDSVYDIPPLEHDKPWHQSSATGLPSLIGISRLASTEKEIISYYHSALCFAYAISEEKDKAHAIIYTPHGIPGPALEALSSSGITEVAGLLHGLHEITNPTILGGKLNLGAHNGLAAAKTCKTRWWIGTHDEVKKGAGIVSVVMKRKVWTVEDALKAAKLDKTDGFQYVTLGSGESMLLE